jgi:FKBP-type peptidyl-prolyl cis-trans isomerase (trigger factor)
LSKFDQKEQKRGQKVNTDFRNLVESKVRLKIFTDAYNKISKNEVDEDSKYGKIVSIAYSYDIIKRAAIKAQSIWINDPKRSD